MRQLQTAIGLKMASIEQRKSSGKWQARIRRAGHPEQSKDFQTKEAAQQWARAIERDMDIGKFIPNDVAETTTFEKAANRYVKEILPGKKSIQQVESAIKLLIEQFGEYALANVTPAAISAYCAKRLETVSAQTVVHDINILTRIFKAASIDWGISLPQGIPTALVRKPRVNGARDRRLEDGEWDLLKNSLSMCESPYPLAVVEFAIETAARQSEIMSLTWQHVDLKKRTARLKGIGGRSTKNDDIYRDVPLSRRAIAVISSLMKPGTTSNKTDLVFSISQAALQKSWKHGLARARSLHLYDELSTKLQSKGMSPTDAKREISAIRYHKKVPLKSSVSMLKQISADDEMLVDFRFHDLRHEGTSRLAEKFQIHELMKVTGHKSIAMLARYYHPKASDLALKLD